MGSPLKMKEFHSIACIERGRTVGGPGHKREICSREYASEFQMLEVQIYATQHPRK